MSAQGAHKVTEMFEAEISRYTGAPYVLAVDNASNGLRLCLLCEKAHLRGKKVDTIYIPNRTYPSVPCEIRLAGFKVGWQKLPEDQKTITGAYRLVPTRIWDAALRFTHNMYLPGSVMVVSFTGAYKHLKLGKGGAILLDDAEAWDWLKRARNSGRSECSYHVDNFTMLGHNFYMMPQIAAQGLLLINQFYNLDGSPKNMPDVTLPYPDLSQFPVYTDEHSS